MASGPPSGAYDPTCETLLEGKHYSSEGLGVLVERPLDRQTQGHGPELELLDLHPRRTQGRARSFGEEAIRVYLGHGTARAVAPLAGAAA